MLELEESYLRFLQVAVLGVILVVTFSLWPTAMVTLLVDVFREVIFFSISFTTKRTVAAFFASALEVTVILTLPAFLKYTLPEALTVATLGLLLLKVTALARYLLVNSVYFGNGRTNRFSNGNTLYCCL